MKVYRDIDLKDFEPWSGAKYTYDKIMDAGKDAEFTEMIEELFPDGIGETELNDLLWFDDEAVLTDLGLGEDEEEEDENE